MLQEAARLIEINADKQRMMPAEVIKTELKLCTLGPYSIILINKLLPAYSLHMGFKLNWMACGLRLAFAFALLLLVIFTVNCGQRLCEIPDSKTRV